MSVRIIAGDCLEVMPTMDADSIDSIVTDPPYGLKFMGKDWDHGIPGEHFWREALRVAKPGAHLLAFGGTRTHHRLMVAIEDAGWEIRDCVMWVYGSGFPKSLDVSKAIDKAAGAERQVVGRNPNARNSGDRANGWDRPWQDDPNAAAKIISIPTTAAARQWQGWGTALKPAWEPIIVARKPFQGSVAANVLKHGTGAINVDGCRVEHDGSGVWGNYGGHPENHLTEPGSNGTTMGAGWHKPGSTRNDLGRWPANVCHDGSDEVVALFPDVDGPWGGNGNGSNNGATSIFGIGGNPDNERYKGNGSAARFFYCAKSSRHDRNDGLQAKGNGHPTVKPTDLMRWLCRLVTPPGGTVLDPFMGSGSTLKAAELEGFSAIGIELDGAHVEIASRRVASDAPLFREVHV